MGYPTAPLFVNESNAGDNCGYWLTRSSTRVVPVNWNSSCWISVTGDDAVTVWLWMRVPVTVMRSSSVAVVPDAGGASCASATPTPAKLVVPTTSAKAIASRSLLVFNLMLVSLRVEGLRSLGLSAVPKWSPKSSEVAGY